MISFHPVQPISFQICCPGALRMESAVPRSKWWNGRCKTSLRSAVWTWRATCFKFFPLKGTSYGSMIYSNTFQYFKTVHNTLTCVAAKKKKTAKQDMLVILSRCKSGFMMRARARLTLTWQLFRRGLSGPVHQAFRSRILSHSIAFSLKGFYRVMFPTPYHCWMPQTLR